MMIIRIFDENRDVDGFLELFRIAFGKPMSREHFEWKYIKNPFRTNIYPIIVVEEEGRLIGTRCRVVSRMMVNGNGVLATMGADGMVNPEFRNRKIYAEMTRVVDELVR